MKKYIFSISIFIFLIFSFFLYQNYDKIKIKKSIKTLHAFALKTELDIQDFKTIYPNLYDIGEFRYWKLKNLIIEEEDVLINTNNEIVIPCIFNDRKVVFVINKKNTREIIDSKGFLVHDEHLVKFIKKIGMSTSYDIEIAKNSESQKIIFEDVVKSILIRTRNNITMEKQSRMDNLYNTSSGVIVVKNDNPIGFSFGDMRLYCNFYNRNKELVSKKELHVFNNSLPAFSTKTYDIFLTQVASTYALEVIINEEVIKEYVSENAKGSNGKYSYNL